MNFCLFHFILILNEWSLPIGDWWASLLRPRNFVLIYTNIFRIIFFNYIKTFIENNLTVNSTLSRSHFVRVHWVEYVAVVVLHQTSSKLCSSNTTKKTHFHFQYWTDCVTRSKIFTWMLVSDYIPKQTWFTIEKSSITIDYIYLYIEESR